MKPRFDSILVRLKGRDFDSHRASGVGFDSILVRLKVQNCRYSLAVLYTRFDSILVRLKAESGDFCSQSQTEFRFHTGSIKSLKCARCSVLDTAVSIPYWFD